MHTTNKIKPVKPVLRWPGGKSRLAKTLLPLIPDHTCYVEPFAGALAILLAKPRSPVEIINDINGDLIALYRCIQYHLPELHRELSGLISSRQMLKDFLTQTGVTDIQRAARFYFRNRTSFGGTMRSFAIAKTAGGGAGFPSARNQNLLGSAAERLDGVVIENVPYERCFALYDSPDSFFFLDPPYLHATPDAYAGWTEPEMEKFHAGVSKLKGRWLVTVDDSPFNRSLFSGCNIRAVQTRNGCCNNRLRSGQKFGELIITKE